MQAGWAELSLPDDGSQRLTCVVSRELPCMIDLAFSRPPQLESVLRGNFNASSQREKVFSRLRSIGVSTEVCEMRPWQSRCQVYSFEDLI